MKTSLAPLVLAAGLLALNACSAPTEVDEASAATSSVTISEEIRSFQGDFKVHVGGSDYLGVNFWVSDIDWAARTARWDTTYDQLVLFGTHDVNRPIKIQTGRCTGCWVFRATEDGSPLAELKFSRGKPTEVVYSGDEGRDLRITSASTSPDTRPAPPEEDRTGACFIMQGESIFYCENNYKAARCNEDGFLSSPPDGSTFTFKVGERCPPRAEE